MATTTKHNIYIYIRVVTKYFYSNYNIYGLSSRPNNNAKIQYFYQIYLDYEIYTGRLSLIRQLWDREGAGLSIFPDYWLISLEYRKPSS